MIEFTESHITLINNVLLSAGWPQLAERVVQACKMQIPKPPKPNTRIPGIGKCQICKTELCIDDDDLHYCPTCGQRLK